MAVHERDRKRSKAFNPKPQTPNPKPSRRKTQGERHEGVLVLGLACAVLDKHRCPLTPFACARATQTTKTARVRYKTYVC